MKTTIACLFTAVAFGAAAQAPPPKTPPGAVKAPKQALCAECGVVASVREVTRQSKPSAAEETKPSGFVVSVPLRGGAPSAGSSTHIGKEAAQSVTTWEVIVRLDDGRVRILTLEDPPEVRKDDKVRIEKGKALLRTD